MIRMQAGIELLPTELKLELLLASSDFPSLFNLCSAIPAFQQVYKYYRSLVQKHILERDYSPGAILLLDRFRPTSEGIGYISLTIFTLFHSWTVRNSSKDGDATDVDTLHQIFTSRELETLRQAFTTEPGIVGCMKEVEFLDRVEQFVDMLYNEAQKYGIRTCRQNDDWILRNTDAIHDKYRTNMSPLASSSDHHTNTTVPSEGNQLHSKINIKRTLLHFLLLSTHFHDTRLALERARTSLGTGLANALEWESATTYKQRMGESSGHPSTIYDYTYASTLCTADLASVLSVATPIVQLLYRPPSNGIRPYTHEDWEEDFRQLWFLRRYVAEMCGLDHVMHAVYSPQWYSPGDSPEADGGLELGSREYQSMFVAFDEACNSGAWSEGYLEKALLLEKKVRLETATNWSRILEDPTRFSNQKAFTTVGRRLEVGEMGPNDWHETPLLSIAERRMLAFMDRWGENVIKHSNLPPLEIDPGLY